MTKIRLVFALIILIFSFYFTVVSLVDSKILSALSFLISGIAGFIAILIGPYYFHEKVGRLIFIPILGYIALGIFFTEEDGTNLNLQSAYANASTILLMNNYPCANTNMFKKNLKAGMACYDKTSKDILSAIKNLYVSKSLDIHSGFTYSAVSYKNEKTNNCVAELIEIEKICPYAFNNLPEEELYELRLKMKEISKN